MTYIKRSPFYFAFRLFPRIATTWLMVLLMSEFVSIPLLVIFGVLVTATLTLLFSLQWCTGIELTKDDVIFIKLFSVQSINRSLLTAIDYDEKSKTLHFKFKDSKTISMKGGFKPQQFSDLDMYSQGK